MTDIPDAAVDAFRDAHEAEWERVNSQAGVDWDTACTRAGLAAAYPYLAAQALREAADARVAGLVAVHPKDSAFASWLRARADELERTTQGDTP